MSFPSSIEEFLVYAIDRIRLSKPSTSISIEGKDTIKSFELNSSLIEEKLKAYS